MTDETMNLQELLEKTTDANFLREMIGFAAQRLMDVEIEALAGVVPVRIPGRLNQRNGYRDHTWATGRARSNCGYRRCARAVTFPASSNRR
jgi:putative transposase